MNEEQLNTNIEPTVTPSPEVPTTEEPTETVETTTDAIVESAPVETQAPEVAPVEVTTSEATPIEETTTPVEETPIAEAPVESAPEETTPVEETTTPVVENTEGTTPEVTPTEAPVETAPEAPIGEANETINPVALETPADPNAKKSKKGLFITIGVILAVIIILGIIFYITQFTTANKKLTTISDKLFESVSTEQVAKIIDKQSGTYKFSASAALKLNDQDMYSGSIDYHGNYGIDTTAKNAYINLDVQNIIFNKQSLIDSANIKFDAEVDNDTAYISIKDLYEQTIKYQDESVQELVDALIESLKVEKGTKSINIEVIKQALNNALNEAIKDLDKKQGVKKVDSLGLTNVITIKLDKATQEKFVKNIYNSLANSSLPTEIAKAGIVEADYIKEALTEAASTYEADDTINATINIYTAMFKSEFYGLSYIIETEKNACVKDNTVLNIINKDNTYKISYEEPNEKDMKLDLTVTENGQTKTYTLKGDIKTPNVSRNYDEEGNISKCETTNEDVTNIDITITKKETNNESSISFKTANTITMTCEKDAEDCEETIIGIEADILSSNTIDATYNESTIDKTKTKDMSELTEEEKNLIMSNIQTKYPSLMQLINAYVGNIFGTATQTAQEPEVLE